MRFTTAALVGLVASAACAGPEPTSAPTRPTPVSSRDASPWGPEQPPFNLEVVLRGDGFGLVRFRQPNDANRIVYLDTWLHGLEPNTSYQLQRAVDTNLDGDCTSTSWLTLGKGAAAQTIDTNDKGDGREALFRDLGGFAAGATFDIHFRVLNAGTSAVALTSDCYRFTVTQ